MAQAAVPLAQHEIFLWGVTGAFMALVAVQGLPLAEALLRGELAWRPTPGRLLGLTGFVAFFLGLGGAVALLLGDATEPKHAIAYGLGWQAILGGYIKGPGR